MRIKAQVNDVLELLQLDKLLHTISSRLLSIAQYQIIYIFFITNITNALPLENLKINAGVRSLFILS